MAAVLSCQADDTDKVVAAIGDCRRLGIEVLPPSVQHSQKHFSVEVVGQHASGEPRRGIRVGLSAIKNVGESAVDAILAERESGGRYRSLDDFCRRVDLKALNKRVLESLIKAGALDEFGARERLLAESGSRGQTSSGRVYVLEGGEPKPVEVRLGLSDGMSTQVVSGLTENQEVIIGTAEARGAASGPGGGLPRARFF